MPDPHLEAMMRGIPPPGKKNESEEDNLPKDRFEIALDKNIRDMVDYIYADSVPTQGQHLLPPEVQRKKIETSLRESFASAEFSRYFDTALEALINDGKQYLEAESYEKMTKNLLEALESLDQVELEQLLDEPLDKAIHLHSETISSIFKIAVAKYTEEQYKTSFALFVLLTTLQNEDFDYWYRAGIAAQQCENYTFAVKAYDKAAALNPDLIGAHLFAAECHLKLHHKSQAEAEFEKAKALSKGHPLDTKWESVFNYVATLVK